MIYDWDDQADAVLVFKTAGQLDAIAIRIKESDNPVEQAELLEEYDYLLSQLEAL
jgi:hypothetical protein